MFVVEVGDGLLVVDVVFQNCVFFGILLLFLYCGVMMDFFNVLMLFGIGRIFGGSVGFLQLVVNDY